MIAVLQRVTEAAVSVAGERVAGIGRGVLALVAVEDGDGPTEVDRMAEKIARFRLFPDANGRMNADLAAVGGELLLVSQFTLVADTARGHRPGFSRSAAPAAARSRIEDLVAALRRRGQAVATGRFGADMQVALINDGPVTFWLEVHPKPLPS